MTNELRPVGTEFEYSFLPNPNDEYSDMLEYVWRYRVVSHVKVASGIAEQIEPVRSPDNPKYYRHRRIWLKGYRLWATERIPQSEIDSGWITITKWE